MGHDFGLEIFFYIACPFSGAWEKKVLGQKPRNEEFFPPKLFVDDDASSFFSSCPCLIILVGKVFLPVPMYFGQFFFLHILEDGRDKFKSRFDCDV